VGGVSDPEATLSKPQRLVVVNVIGVGDASPQMTFCAKSQAIYTIVHHKELRGQKQAARRKLVVSDAGATGAAEANAYSVNDGRVSETSCASSFDLRTSYSSCCTAMFLRAISAAAIPLLWPSTIHVGSTRTDEKATWLAETHTGTSRFTHSSGNGIIER
jgi:hypothetical protein